jgi:hypothetical protein
MMMMDERVVLTSPHFAEHSSGAPRLPQAKKAKKAGMCEKKRSQEKKVKCSCIAKATAICINEH